MIDNLRDWLAIRIFTHNPALAQRLDTNRCKRCGEKSWTLYCGSCHEWVPGEGYRVRTD